MKAVTKFICRHSQQGERAEKNWNSDFALQLSANDATMINPLNSPELEELSRELLSSSGKKGSVVTKLWWLKKLIIYRNFLYAAQYRSMQLKPIYTFKLKRQRFGEV